MQVTERMPILRAFLLGEALPSPQPGASVSVGEVQGAARAFFWTARAAFEMQPDTTRMSKTPTYAMEAPGESTRALPLPLIESKRQEVVGNFVQVRNAYTYGDGSRIEDYTMLVSRTGEAEEYEWLGVNGELIDGKLNPPSLLLEGMVEIDTTLSGIEARARIDEIGVVLGAIHRARA